MRGLLLALALCAAASASAETMALSPSQMIAGTTTVGSLPSCTAGLNGQIYIVTDALLPAIGSAVGGGGAITVVVKCNATSWLVF